MSKDSAVLVFCKPPVAGLVKTRLIGRLSAEQAAAVHRACLQDTVAMVSRARGTRKWLYIAGDRRAAQRLAAGLRLGTNWKVVTQHGADLGERMRNAIEEQLRGGASKVVIVGTDSPWMRRERIEQALRFLDRAEIVLGPSEDGGYYLIGAQRVVPEMFSGIRWGTAEVFSTTVRALRGARIRFRLLRKDFDLDRPKDLRRVEGMARRRGMSAEALRRWVRKRERDRLKAGVTQSSRRRGRGHRSKRQRLGRG